MRLRHLPAFLPTRRAPAFAAADRRSRRDNGLNPLHFAALRAMREATTVAPPRPVLRRLAVRMATVFVPPVGEKFP
ncbi:hypothetical protein [Stenotrophomonas acidaminiphila]|uniref:hypothetical protein n=1 Tax=Stenotrophomonas acidaminiphila TaxID=128780 RepID=UPI0015FB8C6C|nr:hypothetical protein [Stenotrophomonas acidaminiphila]